ncbi:uncharacterized protein BO66DRAFT_74337 [Aspergillus aculeatinus CBS 121060]|uniref:Uncharacterized protein n=1 Tax=Aspergillus aculeatinus CBS 121060 TaxID=1448322 RepID=A0ACD1HBV0_9EURO|nr:hypothetical protein BO66DRAFT_74337 [Aspergillus aculeatinus CBS 121060]RAH70903.1 hypothetical protein BO66DRAFT_74337 [Aspergillus aculeatinus CBS 121060]
MIRGGSILWVLSYTMILFVLVMGALSRSYCVDCLREDASVLSPWYRVPGWLDEGA